jgi:putative transposase
MMSQANLEPPLAAYERFFHPGIFFVTCRAVNGEQIFGQPTTAHLVRSVLKQVRRKFPFRMVGFVILPDHLHLLIRPEDGVAADRIADHLQWRYRREYAALMGVPEEMEVWDPGRSLERMADSGAFAHRLDTIHYDPVQHGVAQRPEEWGESSYRSWLERGLYKLGWGWQRPARLGGG